MLFAIPLTCVGILWLTLIYLNERYQLFSVDRFASTTSKWIAYVWLGVFLLVFPTLVAASPLRAASVRELSRVPFYSLFPLHAILLGFLVGWWLLTQRPPVLTYLNIQRERAGGALMTGFAVGVGGWIFTILLALAIVLVLSAGALVPKTPQPPPMIGWMAALPLWKKGTIVLSAMTIEEAFFRGWLQKRV